MNISWENIDNLQDHFITYLLYKESKTVSQISKIRNLEIQEVNDQLIRAKMEIKLLLKNQLEMSKDTLDRFLELGKDDRIKFMNDLDDEKLLDFKRKIYKRVITEKMQKI
ncbi:hypothetical protein H477_0544 [[Clostridium] sordellii ATCC 9714]|nr:hypothetical protein H477_0544 [[Clostridium] sordellii ATCC 9714] [Paeniclostridium sordellii ATCC 9714]